jgi:hypothetical protein
LVAFNAEVTKKGMLSQSALPIPLKISSEMSCNQTLAFAILVVSSHLLLTSSLSLLTPSEANQSTFSGHCLTVVKVS